MLYLDVTIGDTLSIEDGRVRLVMEKKSGNKVRIGVDAARAINVAIEATKNDPPYKSGLTKRK